MIFTINGQERDFPAFTPGATLNHLIEALALKSDRIAVEYNGTIVRRPEWPDTPLIPGSKLEIVHFVGGGSPQADVPPVLACTP